MTIVRLARLAGRAWAEIDSAVASGGWEPPTATEPAACAHCGDVPWVVRWGAIRVGQDLAGYYYLATTGNESILLCRECWERALGVSDADAGSGNAVHRRN